MHGHYAKCTTKFQCLALRGWLTKSTATNYFKPCSVGGDVIT